MNLLGLGVGLAFGFLVFANGLSDYNVIHDALLLRDFYLYLMFFSGVATAAALLWVLERSRWSTPLGGPLSISRSPVTRNNVLGAMLFGTGWAVAGTCPVPALVMTASGGVLGGIVMAGLFLGILARDAMTDGRGLAWLRRTSGSRPALTQA